MAAARDLGVSIPDQMSVVGYDDSHIAGLSSGALTTIAQDAPALAGSALELVLSRIEGGRREASEVVVPPRLVVRRTSAPRPRALPEADRPGAAFRHPEPVHFA